MEGSGGGGGGFHTEYFKGQSVKYNHRPHTEDEALFGALGQGLGGDDRRGLHAFVHAEQQLQAQSDARVPSQREDANVARHNGRPQKVLHRRGPVRVPIKHPVVSSLVFVIDPVELLICAVLDAVLGNPLISITAALSEDPRYHHHLP